MSSRRKTDAERAQDLARRMAALEAELEPLMDEIKRRTGAAVIDAAGRPLSDEEVAAVAAWVRAQYGPSDHQHGGEVIGATPQRVPAPPKARGDRPAAGGGGIPVSEGQTAILIDDGWGVPDGVQRRS